MYNMSSGFKSYRTGGEKNHSAAREERERESESDRDGKEAERKKPIWGKNRKYYPEHLSRPTHVLEVTLALYLT